MDINDLFEVSRYDFDVNEEKALITAEDAEDAMALLKKERNNSWYDLMQKGYKITKIATRIKISPLVLFCDISHKDIY
jgi:hypothetical protein